MPQQSCFREFAQETSLAGFKYVLPDYGPTFRRFCWAVILIAFTVITAYQLAQQFVGYAQTPLKVTVDKQYPAVITFPTVVLCNNMPWRVTAVRPKSAMHRAITEIYRTPLLNSSIAKTPENNATLSLITDVRSYVHDIAMQKENMIVGCSFKDNTSACNVTSDFVPVLTQNGVCYAFNKDTKNPLTVSTAGSSNGLELVINAETYEAMAGPYTTFGIRASFSPVGAPLSGQFVDTLLGSYTSIGLIYSETTFFEGITCYNKKLRFFDKYTRSSCEQEHIWLVVIENCNCSPYLIPENQINNGTVPAYCNLAKHFQCAAPILEKPPPSDDLTCPKQCEFKDYQASVTQSAAAWTQVKLKSQDIDMKEISVNVLNASEVTKRYIPAINASTQQLFRAVDVARAHVFSLIEEINEINLDSCNLPKFSGGTPPDTYSQVKLEQLTKQDVPNLKKAVENDFNNLNTTMQFFYDNFLFNETYQDLLDNRSTSLDVRDLKNTIFDIKDGYIYIKSLPTWVQVLEALTIIDHSQKASADTGLSLLPLAAAAPSASATTNSLATTSTPGISNINASFYLPDGQRTILSTNDTQNLNATIWSLKPLQLNYDNPTSCWNVPIPKPFRSENPQVDDFAIAVVLPPPINNTWDYVKGDPRVFDMITCLQMVYTTNSLLVTLSTKLPNVNSIFADTDPKSQMEICQAFLCDYLNVELAPKNCTIPSQVWLSAMNLSYFWLFGMLENCELIAHDGLNKLDLFVKHYTDETYPLYTSVLNDVNGVVKRYTDITGMFSSQIWKNDSHYDTLTDNMTAYVHGNIDYQSFAVNVKDVFAPWATNTFMFDASQAKTTLQKMLDLFIEMQPLLNTMTENHKLYTEDEIDKSIGIMPVLESYILQLKNSSHVNASQTLSQCAAYMRTIIAPLINNITNASQTYQQAINKLNDDGKNYLASLVTDDAFFKTNFMVLNVHFTEISVESTQQVESYEFWSLMADLGGASGLWLGFSVVSLVEFIDIFIRHGFRCCSRPARNYRRKREAIKKAEREAMARRDIVSMLALKKARDELELAAKDLKVYHEQQDAVVNTPVATSEETQQKADQEVRNEIATVENILQDRGKDSFLVTRISSGRFPDDLGHDASNHKQSTIIHIEDDGGSSPPSDPEVRRIQSPLSNGSIPPKTELSKAKPTGRTAPPRKSRDSKNTDVRAKR